jgi:hypothetical protein
MADALISYAIVFGVFIALGAILFGSRGKRVHKKKESAVETSEEIKSSPA